MAKNTKTSSFPNLKSASPKKRTSTKSVVEQPIFKNSVTQFGQEDIKKPKFPFFILSKNIIIIFLLILGFGLIYYKKTSEGVSLSALKKQTIPDVVKKLINNPDTSFTVGNVKETNGLYEIELTVGPQKATSYITKDGKIFFVGGVKVDELSKVPQNQEVQPAKKLSCNDLSKSETPKLTAFVVSGCPYGLQMQRLFNKTITELPQISPNLDIKYLGSITNGKITSMHGDEEAQENLKQICIREEQKDKYWSYVSCYMKEGKSDDCLTSSGVNTSSLNTCTTDESKGLKYAQLDFDLANQLSIGSSPTLLLNSKQLVSEFDFGGRIPDAIRQIVGCAYSSKPDAFNKELSKDQVAVSFSLTDEANTQTNTTTNSDCAQ